MVNSSLIFVCPLFTPAMSCVLLCPSHAPWSSCPKSTELSRNALPLETWRPTLFLGWIFKLRRKQVFIQWASQAARRYDISSVIKFRSSGETFFSRRLGVKENFNGPRRCVSQSQVTEWKEWSLLHIQVEAVLCSATLAPNDQTARPAKYWVVFKIRSCQYSLSHSYIPLTCNVRLL